MSLKLKHVVIFLKIKLKLRMIFFKLSLNVLYQAHFSKNTIKMIGHYARIRDVTGQSYPFMPVSRALFVGPSYTLR